jgi:hypothetical protein
VPRALLAAVLAFALSVPAVAAEPVRPPGDAILLTIFLRHDQSRPLPELNAQLTKNGWYEKFPPAGVEVVSWYVVMGIGQVVTLRVPPDRLRDVNLAIENGGWGAYRTEFYPTYDFRPVWDEMQKKRKP